MLYFIIFFLSTPYVISFISHCRSIPSNDEERRLGSDPECVQECATEFDKEPEREGGEKRLYKNKIEKMMCELREECRIELHFSCFNEELIKS